MPSWGSRRNRIRRTEMDTNVRINCETNGFEEATEQIETLAKAYDGFPAQVTVKNCHHCTINIYPSQIVERGEQHGVQDH